MLTLSLVFSLTLSAQKIKVKGDVGTVDGATYCQFEDDPMVRGSFYLNDTQGNQMLYYKWVVFEDLNYFEIYRPEDLENILFDEQAVTGHRKFILKRFYESKVLTPNGIDGEKLNQFASKMGMKFTEQKQAKMNRR